ncbi:putative membrane protein [Brucella thiophenivorans]|uniref:Putative membrane protein n=1 Tax=Brucella thiophenivorans TaxID=571255 RepID=A0A256FVK4_9HYPH|nr:putative membrane protein [Brucella thiophenivorans]
MRTESTCFDKERILSTYFLASGDVLVILAGIFSVAYLSWKRKAK